MKQMICGAGKSMLSRALALLLLLCLTLPLLTSCGKESQIIAPTPDRIEVPGTTENDLTSETYEAVAESDNLVLWLNWDTVHFRVENKADGSVYSSLPAGAQEGEQSLFEISYLDTKGKAGSMNSYSNSVTRGQYRIERLDDNTGVRIHFTLGNVQEKLFCPTAMTVERFEALLEKIEDTFDRTMFKAFYLRTDMDSLNDLNRDKILERYPHLKDGPLYILRKDTMTLSEQRDINRILVDAGYTDEDYAIDMENAQEVKSNVYPAFNITLYLTLKDGRLEARIPLEEVTEFNGAVLTDLTLLKNFASPEKDQDGSFLLPDGTGSVMNCYNGKNDQQRYQVTVYGPDGSVRIDEQIYKDIPVYLPVFGIRSTVGGVFGVIEDADAMAQINASPGDDISRPAVYPLFRIRETAKTYLSSTAKNNGDFFTIYQRQVYEGDLAVSYAFFTKENNSFSHMASYYAGRLFGDRPQTNRAPALVLDFVGVMTQKSAILGISYDQEIAYTTLEQVLETGKDLAAAGAGPMVFRLTGFFNNGIDQTYAGKLKLAKGVGTEKDLEALRLWAKEAGVELYFDTDPQYVYKTKAGDGFSKTGDTSSFVTKDLGLQYGYNKATGQLETKGGRYILNPEAIARAFESIRSRFGSWGLESVSLRNLGSICNADYKQDQEVTRQDAMKRLAEDAERTAGSLQIMTVGANAPVLPFLDSCLQLPMNSTRYDITDGTVPFLQMVLAGRVRYTDVPVNLSGNVTADNLSSLVYGAGFHYRLTVSEDAEVGKSAHPELYSTKYSSWREDILEKSRLLAELAPLTSGGVEGYTMLEKDVVQITYSTGSLVVNFSDRDVSVSAGTVKAGGFLIIESV